jgi:hypothetical protein
MRVLVALLALVAAVPMTLAEPLTLAVTGSDPNTGVPYAGAVAFSSFGLSSDNQIVASGVVDGVPFSNVVAFDAVGGYPARRVRHLRELEGENRKMLDSCSVVDLNLEPLYLNVLGLVITLDTVHLQVDAVPGANALVGNLLCAVLGLLDQVIAGVLGAVGLAIIQVLLDIANQILAGI